MSEKPLFAPTTEPFPTDKIPQAVFDENPALVELYNLAWKQAWAHVYESEHMPQSPYMGEGCAKNRVWIWDTCFMAMYCRYAPEVFPGIESLNNFYRILHENDSSDILVHHPDNPPLFAWTEYLYYQLTGDTNRLAFVLQEKQYLQKHYECLEASALSGTTPEFSGSLLTWKKEQNGYRWTGCPSGMDNTPRGRGDYESILWLDALAQQGLSALYISRIAGVLGESECEKRFAGYYEEKKQLMQKYWDEADGVFYDILDDGNFCKVLTPATFWPALAEMATPDQVERMAKFLTAPDKLGGMVPCPSVSRDDPDFISDGRYWRGGVWLPTSYMTVKALEKFGMLDLAEEVSTQTLQYMLRTYNEYSPHTIWEAYCPDAYMPTVFPSQKLSRPDFCGWSALGPISMLIENIIGLHEISAPENKIIWRLKQSCRHGIENLSFGKNNVSLIYENGTISVSAALPFTLEVNGKTYACENGTEIEISKV